MSRECQRCGRQITWNNGQFTDEQGVPHMITKCSTRPGKVWCPACKGAFPQKEPCEHYRHLKYQPGEAEVFFIRKILASSRGRSPPTKKKPAPCPSCGADLTRFDDKQRARHLKMHEHARNNQKALGDYFN